MNVKPHLIYCATAVFLGLLFACVLRFSITGVGEGRAYKLDRWTGEVVLMAVDNQVFMKAPKFRE
jgi:hypothetical protein